MEDGRTNKDDAQNSQPYLRYREQNKNNHRSLSFHLPHGNTIIIKSHIPDNTTNESDAIQSEMAD